MRHTTPKSTQRDASRRALLKSSKANLIMDTQPNAHAIRNRRYRAHKRDGCSVWSARLPDEQVVQAMLEVRTLKPEHVGNPLAERRGFQKFLDLVVREK